ncbi:hypothetical protein ACGF1Z_06980 [Streptomyces sp. NPDC048018]|uniref:hypothetical protein n=1 Tax=Streptomyces sp. NPDC048018 TaxID=3365499 RepID=UPI003717CFDA
MPDDPVRYERCGPVAHVTTDLPRHRARPGHREDRNAATAHARPHRLARAHHAPTAADAPGGTDVTPAKEAVR